MSGFSLHSRKSAKKEKCSRERPIREWFGAIIQAKLWPKFLLRPENIVSARLKGSYYRFKWLKTVLCRKNWTYLISAGRVCDFIFYIWLKQTQQFIKTAQTASGQITVRLENAAIFNTWFTINSLNNLYSAGRLTGHHSVVLQT